MKTIIATMALFSISISAAASISDEELSPHPLLSPKLIMCDENNRPQMCAAIYKPVCALKKDKNGLGKSTKGLDSASYFNEGSACMACGDPEVIGYYEGNCQMKGARFL